MKTGEIIMRYRKKNGYTLEQLAALVGVDALTVDRWESGLEVPDHAQLVKLCDVFGCRYEKLIPDYEQEPQRELGFSWTSRRSIRGLPLVDIDLRFGGKASGVIAIGFMSKGIVSVGVVSAGIVSAGLLTAGVFTAGLFAVGLLFTLALLGVNVIDGFIPWIEMAWGFLTAGL